METTSPAAVVESYLAAIARRDFDAARTHLADSAFRYTSPIGDYDDADRFIESISRIGQILVRLDTRLRFSSGEHVCTILDATTAISEYRTQSVVHLARVTNVRIAQIELILDASEYHRMFAPVPSP
ncbi:MAG: hypothetical protein ABFS23_01545 [Pseudomonadota bacterium]